MGRGAFGSAALWRLAARGADVAGIERFGIGHDQGSSHGATRLFRIACQEHVGLSRIAKKSLELWTALGNETGQTLIRRPGPGAAEPRRVHGPLPDVFRYREARRCCVRPRGWHPLSGAERPRADSCRTSARRGRLSLHTRDRDRLHRRRRAAPDADGHL
nr:FAD-dependent oxidoreductase [Psychromicrobium sp. YIM S02556]